MELNKIKGNILQKQKGFSLPELVIVMLIIAILLVLALPQIIASRRLFKFSGIQRQIASSLRDARQDAISQRKAVTLRYDDVNKRLITYGGKYGAFGDAKNLIVGLSGAGVDAGEIRYGRPGGVSTAALNDQTNITTLASNMVEVTFQPDGTVLNASNNPENKALFFYHSKIPQDTAFAVSVLGAGGRVKIWRYSKGVNLYVE